MVRDDSPLIAALHPVNAVLIVVLSIVLIRLATDLMRQEREAGGAATAVDG